MSIFFNLSIFFYKFNKSIIKFMEFIIDLCRDYISPQILETYVCFFINDINNKKNAIYYTNIIQN